MRLRTWIAVGIVCATTVACGPDSQSEPRRIDPSSIPFGLLEGGWGGLATASPEALASMVYLGVIATVVAFVFWYEGVSRIGPSRASAFTFLVPIVGVSSSVLVLGERPGPTTLLGGAIVLLALWIIQRAPR